MINRCKECDRTYFYDEENDEFGTGLCCYCFEGALEQYEEDRRRKIAERNEY